MSQEVRCFCQREPLLAVCGRDTRSGQPFVHVKTWKQRRLYTEVVVTSGEVRIRCRECFRWHTIRIVHLKVDITPEDLPETIQVG